MSSRPSLTSVGGLLVLVIGLGTGVYLVQKPKPILPSRAGANPLTVTSTIEDTASGLPPTQIYTRTLGSKDKVALLNGVPLDQIPTSPTTVIADDENSIINRVIVEFTEPPLAAIAQEHKRQGLPPGQAVAALKQAKQSLHDTKKAHLQQMEARVKHPLRPHHQFDTAINATVINATEADQAELKTLPFIKNVEPVRPVTADLNTSTAAIKAPAVYPLFDGRGLPITGKNVTIGVIDTGVDYTHPDLGGCIGATCRVKAGYDFVNNDADPIDDHGHGTHVAATAAGRPPAGSTAATLIGVAPDATIYAYKVLGSSGSGSNDKVIAAIERCTDPNQDGDLSDHLDVCTLSLGGGGNPDDAGSRSVDNSTAVGVTYTIAAGNSGPSPDTIGSPGNARQAITVGASCHAKTLGFSVTCESPITSFSSRGPIEWTGTDGLVKHLEPAFLPKPDIVAPGYKICAAERGLYNFSNRCLDDTHIAISGTSMATPHVAGAVALLKQAYPAADPALIKDTLKKSAVPFAGFDENAQGKGLIDLVAALKLISPNLDFSPALATTPPYLTATVPPGQSTYTTTITFSVTNTTNTSTTLTPQPLTNEYVTLTPALATLPLPAHDTKPITYQMSVNRNLTLGSTTYPLVLQLASPLKNLSLSFELNIQPKVSVGNIDFGLDVPTQNTWTSTQNLTITNHQPESLTLTVAPPTLPPGINFSLPQTINLAGQETKTIPITATVQNNLIANQAYTYIAYVSSATQPSLPIKLTFNKYFRLRVNHQPAPEWLTLHDQGTFRTTAHPDATAATTEFLFTTFTSRLNLVNYYFDLDTATATFIVKEIPSFDGDDTVTVGLEEATITYNTNTPGLGGEQLPQLWSQTPQIKHISTAAPGNTNRYINFPNLIIKTNPISADYRFTYTLYQPYDNYTVNNIPQDLFVQFAQDGIAPGNKTLTYTAGQLRLVTLYGHPSLDTDQMQLRLSLCNTIDSVTLCSGGYPRTITKAHHFAYQLHTLPLTSTITTPAQQAASQYVRFSLGGQPFTGARTSFTDQGIIRVSPYNTITPLITLKGDRLDIGQLTPLTFNRLGWTFGQCTTAGCKFSISFSSGARYYTQHLDEATLDMPVEVTNNGQSTYKKVISKYDMSADLSPGFTGPGAYAVTFAYPVTLAGQSLTHRYSANFTVPDPVPTSSQDLNPPIITLINLTADGDHINTLDPQKQNQLTFRLSSVDGIGNIAVTYGLNDGSAPQSLSYTYDAVTTEYKVNIPSPATTSLHQLTLTAYDTHQNFVSYRMELPVAPLVSVALPPPDNAKLHIAGVKTYYNPTLHPIFNKQYWHSYVDILIHNFYHQPVNGIDIRCKWLGSDAVNGCTTGTNGWCSQLFAHEVEITAPDQTCEIKSIYKYQTPYTYYPAENHDLGPDATASASGVQIKIRYGQSTPITTLTPGPVNPADFDSDGDTDFIDFRRVISGILPFNLFTISGVMKNFGMTLP